MPLAAELGFQRLDAHTVGLHAAVAAAFTHQLIDDDAGCRVNEGAALAAAALFSGAGLVVDDDGASLDFAELPLQRIELVAVVHCHAFWKPSILSPSKGVVLFGLIRHHYCFNSTFRPY